MTNKKRKTNRELLESFDTRFDRLDIKFDRLGSRIDQTNDRMDGVYERFDALRRDIDSQFNNHLSTHENLNKRIFKGVFALVLLIVFGVFLNNVNAIAKFATLAWKFVF